MKKILFACLLFSTACQQKRTLFERLKTERTGILFNNTITENDSINPIDMEFLYNGGGVAIGDFNNDHLPDIYFTASQVSNKLYLNKGSLSFADVTREARVDGEGRWCNAASVVDINNDGWQDIYICTSIKKDPRQRQNLFYINTGNQANGIPVFEERAVEMNLADTGFSVHAPFFDYDNDGDLDAYVVSTKLAERNSTRFDGSTSENRAMLSDKLYRNDGPIVPGGLPTFTNVSEEAGIKDEGFGLGVCIADVNDDGWKDIYVTNDFFSNDLLYINQQNGRYVNKAAACFKHTSRNAMGNDIADINNDALTDIIAVDMNPEDNLRKKTNLAANNYYQYQNMMMGTIMLQYVRNTLQLNNGLLPDTSGQLLPVFSDISYHAGVAETDWSWSSLFADFDNDGFKDLFITNGYPKDVTDHDFAFFQSNYSKLITKEKLLAEIPQVKIPNYAFRNASTSLRFENVSEEWGMQTASFSCGAAYADLDGDGDLDYIVSNINDEAFVYENRLEEFTAANFLNIQFRGDSNNKAGIGAIAKIYYDTGKIQLAENSPYRGYLSTVATGLHFGLGITTRIDSILVKWPGGKQEVLHKPGINRTLIADIRNATVFSSIVKSDPLFNDITIASKINLRHQEADYIDFDIQRLLPHKLSEYGPALAVADVDANGLDDLFMGCGRGFEPNFLLQQTDGLFIKKELPPVHVADARKPEVLGSLLFDADGDKDPDLYLTSGSNESVEGSKDYQDRFYVNDGKGNFRYDSAALPKNLSSKHCLKATDFDHDGDLDLFAGSRVIPGKYPLPASGFIFRNDSRPGMIRFTDVTSQVAPALTSLGLICDALWTDIDNDGWQDLLVAGEWMPVTVLKNHNGHLKKVNTGTEEKRGWWTSILGGDFDNDGDIDYVLGNAGDNSYYRGDSTYPLRIYNFSNANNGKDVVIPTLYLPDASRNKKEFPAHSRDELIGQVPLLKKKFLSYQSFGNAAMSDFFTAADLNNAYQLHANFMKSVLLINKGGFRFDWHPLPELAQLAPLNGMITEDINGDGFLDIMACGNDYGPEIGTGRMDAMNGLVMLGNSKGKFNVLPLTESGLFVPGNAMALAKIKGADNQYLLAASQNRSLLKLFKSRSAPGKLISLQDDDTEVYFTMTNGTIRKEELYYGHSFLSQSSRFVCKGEKIKKIEVVNNKAQKRTVE